MLNKEAILSHTENGLAVFRHYMGDQWRVGKNFKNPFYEDKNASCSVFFDNKSRQYKLNDFGDNRYSGDCFALVALLKGIDCRRDFSAVLQHINADLHLGLEENSKSQNYPPKSRPTPIIPPPTSSTAAQAVEIPFIPPATKAFSKRELMYWEHYGISEATLNLYRVISVVSLSGINREGKPYTLQATEQEPIFGYMGKGFAKYYRPLSKNRFLYAGKKPDDYVFGWEQLPAKGEAVFITGGEKDVMSLYARLFPAICMNSETASIPERIIKNLSYRFQHIVLLYDTDSTGLEASLKHEKQLAKYEVKRLVLPLKGTKEDKDISDYFASGKSRKELLSLFLRLLSKRYENTFAILKPCAIDFAHPPRRPDPLIKINDVVIASPCNIVSIAGSEGSGKSNYTGAIIAGALNVENQAIDTLNAEVAPNKDGKALLIYDTEQTDDQLYRNLCNILRRAKIEKPPAWLNAYGIAHLARKERLTVIRESMDAFYFKHGGIHMVVIDGIADLISSVNDEGESVMLVEELYRMAAFYKTCIICVLHLSPSGYKLRGHLGSELQRKASGILCVERDEASGNSILKAIKVREGNPMDVPQLLFGWDTTLGYHMSMGAKPVYAPNEQKKVDLEELAKTVFLQKTDLSYSELCEAIQKTLSVKDRMAKSYIKQLKEQGILQSNSGNFGRYSYQIPQG